MRTARPGAWLLLLCLSGCDRTAGVSVPCARYQSDHEVMAWGVTELEACTPDDRVWLDGDAPWLDGALLWARHMEGPDSTWTYARIDGPVHGLNDLLTMLGDPPRANVVRSNGGFVLPRWWPLGTHPRDQPPAWFLPTEPEGELAWWCAHDGLRAKGGVVFEEPGRTYLQAYSLQHAYCDRRPEP